MPAPNPEMESESIRLNGEGFTNTQIGEMLGIPRKSVGYYLSKRNLKSARVNQKIVMVDDVNAECTKCGKVLLRADLPWGRVTTKPYQLSYCRRCLTEQVVRNTKRSIPQYLMHRHRAIKAKCQQADVPFDLPGGYLADLYEKQKGLCFYTDEEMKVYFGTKKSGARRNSLSVDKILPEVGYIPGNIVLCIARANSVKHDCTIQEIRNWMPGWYARIIQLWKEEGVPYELVPGWEEQ